MLRKLIRAIVRALFTLLSDIDVKGLGNIPAEGGFILCSNHLGIIDAPLIFMLLEREDVTAFVAKKYKRNPFLRLLVNALDGIWLNRTEADTRAIRVACEYLHGGGGLGIAPEGTRSKTGALSKAKSGVAYLAHKAGVPIIPVAISGTESAFRQLFHLQRPRIRVIIGSPFSLPPIERTDRDRSLQRNTDEIMCHIAALLPPEYRGVYAEHPRLKEMMP